MLAVSDALALGALYAAREKQLRVPADLSVVGFDDSPRAQFSTPPLTTIRRPHVAKGRRAGDLLLTLVSGESPQSPELLPTELIIRASTGPAPTGRPPSA